MPEFGPAVQGLAQRMTGGGAPAPPGPGPAPMGPQGGGGDPVAELQQHLQAAVLLTIQAGPQAFPQLGEVWKGAFGAIDRHLAPMRQQMGGNPQMGPPPGPGGMPPQGPPQMGPAGPPMGP